MILDEIMAHKRRELERRRQAVPLDEVRGLGEGRSPPLDLAAALRQKGVCLIAEVKRASPSKGLLCPDFDPTGLAETYAGSGAAAISVLTDDKFFQGKLEHLTEVKSQISGLRSPIPILRKDFIFTSYQVHEAYALGADAVLLIAAVLPDQALDELLGLTQDLGMTALVEVHSEEELRRVLPVEPRVVGINNRDLHDFSVDLNMFGRLRSLLPDEDEVVAVAESGVRTAEDVQRLTKMGADAVLVGEALVTARDISAKVQELVAGGLR